MSAATSAHFHGALKSSVMSVLKSAAARGRAGCCPLASQSGVERPNSQPERAEIDLDGSESESEAQCYRR
eukprot:277898-Rhodomonas_salina.2